MSFNGSDDGSVNATPEPLQPGVVRIKPAKKYGLFTSVFIRVALGLLFLGVGVFAVAYSVYKSENKETTDSGEPHVNITDYFEFNRTQECLQGILTIEQRLGDSPSGLAEHNTTKFSTVWAQDDIHKRLFHQVASNGTVLYQHFVFPTCAIYATNKDCNVNYNINYTSYLQQFGLDSLTKLRIEQIRISNSDPNQKTYANITLYRGEPSDSTLYSFNGGVLANPKLAMAYTDVSTGTLYSWQLYFPRNKLNQTSLYWVEYWYPQMVPSISDSAIFFDFPSYCSNFTGCVNK